MIRCVVRYPNLDQAPAEDLERVVRDRDIEMIDKADRGLALVDVPDGSLSRLRELLPGWRIQPEQQGKLP